MANLTTRSSVDVRPSWVESSLVLLRRRQNADGGWPYFAEGDSAIEPTATAVAALHALDLEPDARRRGLAFLASMQVVDGALKPQPSQADATGMAALAGLVLARCGNDRTCAIQIADALHAWKPRTTQRSPVFGNDPRLVGFCWTPNTFSWVEPTAYAVLLFDALGRGPDPRVAESRKLLVDRAIPGGGWNYGNTIVFGTVLEPDPLVTAWAILALLDDPARAPVARGAEYLHRAAGGIDSPLTLAWAAMALRATGDRAAVDLDRFGPLLADGFVSAASPWHHAAALLASALTERNPFVRQEAAA